MEVFSQGKMIDKNCNDKRPEYHSRVDSGDQDQTARFMRPDLDPVIDRSLFISP